MGRTILLPIDPSENCKRALKFYIDTFFNKEDTIIFLHVLDPAFKGQDEDSRRDSVVPISNTQKVLDSGKALTHKYLAWGRDAGLKVRAFVQYDSKPGVTILNAVKEHGVDHIILASRGLNALGRTLMGSVSDYVVHHATVPVTVIPTPEEDRPTRGLRRISMY